jgi:hypothetical protein
MEFIPFLHSGRSFNIACVDDLEFKEVRSILDQLIELQAFDSDEVKGSYRIDAEENEFQVWVMESDVFIQRL